MTIHPQTIQPLSLKQGWRRFRFSAATPSPCPPFLLSTFQISTFQPPPPWRGRGHTQGHTINTSASRPPSFRSPVSAFHFFAHSLRKKKGPPPPLGAPRMNYSHLSSTQEEPVFNAPVRATSVPPSLRANFSSPPHYFNFPLLPRPSRPKTSASSKKKKRRYPPSTPPPPGASRMNHSPPSSTQEGPSFPLSVFNCRIFAALPLRTFNPVNFPVIPLIPSKKPPKACPRPQSHKKLPPPPGGQTAQTTLQSDLWFRRNDDAVRNRLTFSGFDNGQPWSLLFLSG